MPLPLGRLRSRARYPKELIICKLLSISEEEIDSLPLKSLALANVAWNELALLDMLVLELDDGFMDFHEILVRTKHRAIWQQSQNKVKFQVDTFAEQLCIAKTWILRSPVE